MSSRFTDIIEPYWWLKNIAKWNFAQYRFFFFFKVFFEHKIIDKNTKKKNNLFLFWEIRFPPMTVLRSVLADEQNRKKKHWPNASARPLFICMRSVFGLLTTFLTGKQFSPCREEIHCLLIATPFPHLPNLSTCCPAPCLPSWYFCGSSGLFTSFYLS